MASPPRGFDDYRSEEREDRRHSPFSHRPPPPPPSDFGGRPFDERREEYEGGFPPRHGRHGEDERFGGEDDEASHGRRRGEYETEAFSGGDGHPPGEGRPHFPHMQGFHRPSHAEGFPLEGEAPAPYDHSARPQHDASSHSFMHSVFHHRPRPSDEDPNPVKEDLPAGEDSITGQLDSLSLDLPQGRLVRISCKENSDFNLAVDHNSVEMQESNTEDESQQWIKDVSHGVRIKDSYGYPAFSLVNKKTKKVLKHEKEQGRQVLVVDYTADMRDDDILWTESQDFGEGFKTVRCAGNTLLNLTIFEGNKRIRNGSALMLDSWHKGDHQLWKIFPLD